MIVPWCFTPRPSVAHEFEIPLSEVDAGGKEYHLVLRAAWVRSVLEDADATTDGKDGTVDVRMSKSDNDVAVHGRIRASLTATCGRCLGPAHIAIDQELTGLFVPKSSMKTPGDKEYEFQAEEADVLTYVGETVVLDDLVRDELLLEIPMIPLCSEDCPGIAAPPISEQSSTPAVDPRLAPLLSFKPSFKPTKK